MDPQDDEMLAEMSLDVNEDKTNSRDIMQLELKVFSCISQLTDLQTYVNNNMKNICCDLEKILAFTDQLKNQKGNRIVNGDLLFESLNIAPPAVQQRSNRVDNFDFDNATNDWHWREDNSLANAYFPQIGDSVVFCKNIYQKYLNNIRKNKLHSINVLKDNQLILQIDDQNDLFFRVNDIKYYLNIPGLCKMQLQYISDNDELTDRTFTITYHKSAICTNINFLVLRQVYDDAIEKWKPNDKFRKAIDGKWHFGEVLRVRQFLKNEELDVIMDGSKHLVCDTRPWEIESVDETRLPKFLGETIPILPNEIKPFDYKSQPNDWPPEGKKHICQDVLRRLYELDNGPYGYQLSHLYGDSSYTEAVAYPIDLEIIKSRLESGFYRRLKALRFDMDYLKKNVKDIRVKNTHLSEYPKEEYEELLKSDAKVDKIIIMEDKLIQHFYAELSLNFEEPEKNGEYTLSVEPWMISDDEMEFSAGSSTSRNADNTDSDFTPALKKSKLLQSNIKIGESSDSNYDFIILESNVQGCSNRLRIGQAAMANKTIKNQSILSKFTSKEFLNSIGPNKIISQEIIGKVFDIKSFSKTSSSLLTFCLECCEGSFIKINHISEERNKILDKIKLHEILSIQNLCVGSESKFVKGNIPYDLSINFNTIIRRWTKEQKWEIL